MSIILSRLFCIPTKNIFCLEHTIAYGTPERYETWAKGPRCLNGGLFKDKDVSEPCV